MTFNLEFRETQIRKSTAARLSLVCVDKHYCEATFSRFLHSLTTFQTADLYEWCYRFNEVVQSLQNIVSEWRP